MKSPIIATVFTLLSPFLIFLIPVVAKRLCTFLVQLEPRVTYNNPWEVSGERLLESKQQHSVKD